MFASLAGIIISKLGENLATVRLSRDLLEWQLSKNIEPLTPK